MKRTLSLSIVTLITAFSYAQNVAINADASLPNSSAMLDVKSANKGLLMPRVALTGKDDITTIASPVASLMIYNTATTTGTSGTGSASGMSIPVVAGSRLMMVVSATVSFGSVGAGYSIPLYFSGGVNMIIQ